MNTSLRSQFPTQPTRKIHHRSTRAALALAIAAGLGTYAGSHALLAQEGPNAQQRQALQHAHSLSDAFKFASKTMAPSVVNVRSTQHSKPAASTNQSPRLQPQMPDDMLRRFFGDQMPDSFGMQIPNEPPRDRVGEGTGVILRENGYIVTNNHVIDGADELLVTLDDDREYPATVVGADPATDLAVIKIDAAGLTAAKIGDSEAMEVGEWVIAMGSPFGLQHTVTAGIISAKGRGNMGLAQFEDYIQTDAAINPGNSGGPLINLNGEVIGINTAISSRSGSNAGIGFAIPSAMMQTIFEDLLDDGSVQRGALGVGIEPLNKELAEHFGFEDGINGAVVTQVYPNSAAERAGLKVGDIITEVNGRTTADNRVLMNTVAKHAPGETIELTVFRDGKTKTFEATLGDRAKQFGDAREAAKPSPKSGKPQPSDDLGLSVEELTEEIAAQLNAGDRKGVVISEVQAGSPAAGKGLQRGDLITMVGRNSIETVEDFNAALKQADLAKGIALQVFRGDAARLVVLKAGTSQ